MSQDVENTRIILENARARGTGATIAAFIKLSGPGWMQGAITLGGGSLASGLYLGVLGGYQFLWLQPIAMILGIVMLSAISYVTLSTGERPFDAIKKHVNPVMGWGWVIAVLLANLVWVLPQFALATAAIRQNLLPNIFGGDAMDANTAKIIVSSAIMVICIIAVSFYHKDNKGQKILDNVLKLLVALIVLSFIGVVIILLTSENGLDLGVVLAGFKPSLSIFTTPAASYNEYLSATGEQFSKYWSNIIVTEQRKVVIAAFSTVIGINMTFLLPYSIIKRGWDKSFRSLAIFDLSIGLFVPFVVAISCVVISAAAQFHAKPAAATVLELNKENVTQHHKYFGRAKTRIAFEMNDRVAFDALTQDELFIKVNALPLADKNMASMLIKRGAFDLGISLAPLAGKKVAQYIFGFGVLAMGISTIIILMMINGLVVCEMFGKPNDPTLSRIGSYIPAIGVIGPIIWTGTTAMWMAVPTSMFGMVLLPIAYFSFWVLMNQKKLLGDQMPQGGTRLVWNVFMGTATCVAIFGAYWSINSSHLIRKEGYIAVSLFLVLVVITHFVRKKS